MTMWLPSLTDRPGPKYLRIADALSEDAGRMAPGDRLPTHRELAWRLGVTVGTVSRAYAEAERRGLLVGEVGRGSYVKAGARSTATLAMPDAGGPAMIDLGINKPAAKWSASLSYLSPDANPARDRWIPSGPRMASGCPGRW